VQSSSDPYSEREVIDILRDWRFHPGTKDGSPIAVPCVIEFVRGKRPSSPTQQVEGIPGDPILNPVWAAMDAGDEALKKQDRPSATSHYREAIELSRRLPYYDIKARALKKLADELERGTNLDETESLLAERLRILEEHSKFGGLEVGLALFDLECLYGAAQQIEKAQQTALRADAFYKSCMDNNAEARPTCDRGLADVEAMMGFFFFNSQRFGESEPWLQRMVAREDEKVRPSFMLLSLRAYAKLLRDRGETEQADRMAQRAVNFERTHPGLESQTAPGLHPKP
jgi:tetratricopeptide (TPR) repeat protein